MTDLQSMFKQVVKDVPTYTRRRPAELNHLNDAETCAAGYHTYRINPGTMRYVGGCRSCGTPFVRDDKNW